MPNPIVHFEISGSDAKKTQEFYASVFGWEIDANNPFDYGMVAAQDGQGIGGGLQRAQGEPSVTIYADVADLAATLAKAEAAGGKIVMPPTEVPGGPKLAQFSDIDGNVIGLTEAGSM